MTSEPGGVPPMPGTRDRTGLSGGRIVMLVIGAILALLGLGLLAGGATVAWLGTQHGADGYWSAPVEELRAPSGIVTLGTGRTPDREDDRSSLPFAVGDFRVALSSADSSPIFIGVAPTAEVDRYLAGVHRSEISSIHLPPFRVTYRDIAGDTPPGPPQDEGFWIDSASGAGTQEISWNLLTPDWTVVVMAESGQAPLLARGDVGIRSDLFVPVSVGLFVVGGIVLVVGLGLIVGGAVSRRRDGSAAVEGASPRDISAGWRYPVGLTGRLDPVLSRWLWLVKWILVIPHWFVLLFLWFALAVTTVVSGFAILFTGRYPRPLFDFAIGVLRWTWRVSFYAYSALGTDRYPPFSLEAGGYPADLSVDYPERLSRGLVLVKWWLLALPQLLIVAVLSGGVWWLGWGWPRRDDWFSNGATLLGLLVLVAGVSLLFAGRYPAGLFDLMMGINRWTYRVIAYTLLLRDEYPPFRLDQGPEETVPVGFPPPPR